MERERMAKEIREGKIQFVVEPPLIDPVKQAVEPTHPTQKPTKHVRQRTYITFDEPHEAREQYSLDEVQDSEERGLKVRLDKWLWAARFFKTRALARAAVEAGKVYYNGERSKPTREIEVGAILQVRHGRFEKTVIVKGLSTRRRSTEEAYGLFEETEESRIMREQYLADFPPTPRSQNEPVQSAVHGTRFLRRSFVRQERPGTVYSNPTDNQPLIIEVED